MTKFQTPDVLLGLAQALILKDWQPVWCPQRQSGSFSPEAGCTGGAPFPTILTPPKSAHKLAFRPPLNVLVLDVDHYEDKHGMDTIDKAEAWLGPLPGTYRVTSRGYANPSGRYLYRIPEDLLVTDSSLYQFADEAGRTDVEIVRTGHRFSWAAGDYHYKNDELITCWNELGETCDMPAVAGLPVLPEKWAAYFRNPPVPQKHEAYTRPSDGAEWWLSQADESLASDTELASFAYNMLLSRVPEEEIYRQWSRVAKAETPGWLWERKDFDRHVRSQAQYKAGKVLARQDAETAWMAGTGADLEGIAQQASREFDAASKLTQLREDRIVAATQFQQNFTVIPLEYEEEESEYFAPVLGTAPVLDIAALIRSTPEYDRQYKTQLARMQAEKDVAKVLARDFVDYEAFDELPPAPAPVLFKVTGKDSSASAVIAPRTVTVLSGHRSSGKTWVAATWSAQILRAGGHVLWIDFERQNRLLREKFDSLCVLKHLLKKQFHYTGGMPPIGRIIADVDTWTSGGDPVLVVVDAFRGLQSLIAPGTSANDGDAVENVYLEVLNQVVAAGKKGGATVTVIDHMSKTGDKGTFGSERKESAADYVLKVEQATAFSRSKPGFSSVTVSKDRYGHVAADAVAGYLWHPGDGSSSGPSVEQYPDTPELRNWSPDEAGNEAAVELSLKGQRETVLTQLVQEQPFKLSINKLADEAMAGYPELFPSESSTKRYIREMVTAVKLDKDSGTGRLATAGRLAQVNADKAVLLARLDG